MAANDPPPSRRIQARMRSAAPARHRRGWPRHVRAAPGAHGKPPARPAIASPGTPEEDRAGAVQALDRRRSQRIIAGRQIAQTKLKPGNRLRQGDQSPVTGKPDLHPVRLTHCFYGRHRHRSSQDPCEHRRTTALPCCSFADSWPVRYAGWLAASARSGCVRNAIPAASDSTLVSSHTMVTPQSAPPLHWASA
jgi:hypothetical protein